MCVCFLPQGKRTILFSLVIHMVCGFSDQAMVKSVLLTETRRPTVSQQALVFDNFFSPIKIVQYFC